jgi:hypothetical protein
MSRIFIVCLSVGFGLVQAACGSSKTTATSTSSTECTAISDAELVAIFPPTAADPNAQLIYGSLGTSADATFATVTKSIVTGALAASPNDLGSSFQTKLATASTERQTEFTTNLQNFLASAFGGPAYPTTAPQMAEAHSDLNITVAQYNAFLTGVVLPALAENQIPQATIDLMTPVVTDPNFVKTVVSCK